MIFKRLTLFNFGIYAGENTFTFNGEKPIVLVGGLNGHGKTTFLDSILLVLYGNNSLSFQDSKTTSYIQYLNDFINRNNGNNNSYIELEFTLEDTSSDIYKIKRSWNDLKKTTDSVKVFINDVEDGFLSKNWNMFIENILPSALSKFFIFDGEKIIAWAVDNNNKQIKDSILALLGLTVLDNLKNDLKRILSKKTVSNEDFLENSELNELKNRISSIQKKIKEKQNELDKIENNKLNYINEENEIRNQYSTSGGNISKNIEDIKLKKIQAELELKKLKEKDIDIASRELPLLMLEPLFDNILEKSIEEIESSSLKQSIEKIKKLSEEFTGKNNIKSKQDINNFISFLEDNSSQQNEIIYNLSQSDYYKMEDLKNNRLKNIIEEYKDNKKEFKKITKKIKEYDNALSIDIDNDKINILDKNLKDIQIKISECNTNYEIISIDINSLNSTLKPLEREYEEKVSDYLSKVELNNDNIRVNKYAHMAINILQKFKDRIIANKINDLSTKMTECFKELIGKKNLISKIEIDPISLDFNYYNDKNEIISPNKLSAGEKQIVVISLLWSLSLSTEKKLPVIIDTPLSRLDTVNRTSLVKSYFPNASKQTIILSTDSEIDKKYYDMISNKLDKEYTLIYNDKEGCTKINDGYFKGTI